MTETSYHERLAFAVAKAVLGVDVEPYDRNGRQRAVDAVLHCPGNEKAALEVTCTGPETEVPIQHYLGERGHSRTIAGVAGTWVVQLPRTFHPADLRKVEEELRRCEEQEGRRLGELANAAADHAQLVRQGVRADLVETTGARVHFVLPPTAGPAVPAQRGLPGGLDAMLGTKRIQSKLDSSGGTELTLRTARRTRGGARPIAHRNLPLSTSRVAGGRHLGAGHRPLALSTLL